MASTVTWGALTLGTGDLTAPHTASDSYSWQVQPAGIALAPQESFDPRGGAQGQYSFSTSRTFDTAELAHAWRLAHPAELDSVLKATLTWTVGSTSYAAAGCCITSASLSQTGCTVLCSYTFSGGLPATS
jgi:hypothetical protein